MGNKRLLPALSEIVLKFLSNNLKPGVEILGK